MKFIDMHCDTILNYMVAKEGESLLRNAHSVDFERMHAAGQLAQFFALFFLPQTSFNNYNVNGMTDDALIERCVGFLKSEVEKHADKVAFATNRAQILQNEKDGKSSVVLTFEDGRAAQGKLENIKKFYDMGVRLIGLLWNAENCFGAPNSLDKEIMAKGLTTFGIEAVQYMNELGILIDVSHLSDGGFYDVLKYSKKPFVASHSNCRALAPHRRNLTDDMIKALANAGGVAGINYHPPFLGPTDDWKQSTIELMVAHIKHMHKLGGIDVIGLGSDFDGIEGELEVGGTQSVHLLLNALGKAGFSEGDVEKIAYKNAMRVIGDTMK